MKKLLSAAVIACLLVQNAACLAEGETLTEPPAQTSSAEIQIPAPDPTDAPTAVPTEVPTEAPTNAPAAVPAEAPPEVSNEVPTDAPAAVPAEAPPEVSNEVPTDAPAEPPTDAPAEPPTDAPAEPPTDAPAEPPTDAPAEPPTDAPAEPPTDAPAEPPTDAPAEPPTDAPTESPTDDPEQEPTQSPEETPVPTPTADPGETPNPTETPAVPPIAEDAEAWMELDGVPVGGTLAELIAQASEDAKIYLLQDKPAYLEEAPVLLLSTLNILPDPEVFRDGNWQVVYTSESPEDVEDPAELDAETFGDAKPEDVMPMYVWVREKLPEPTPSPEPTEEPQPDEVQIAVAVQDYTPAVWSAVSPRFTLSGVPEGKPWRYAALIFDERFEAVEGDVYLAEQEGVYTLRFVILDEFNDILASSELYTILHDHTAPEVSAMVDGSMSFTLTLTASDAVSRVESVSVDGGETWSPLAEGSMFTYTAAQETTLEPGQIQVRDGAGNCWISTEPYVLKAISTGGWGGGGGGGGGGGSGKKPQPHASGDGEDEGEYDALALKLSDAPMHALVIDDVEQPLTLELVNAEGFDCREEEYIAQFTAQLAAWKAPETEEDESEIRDVQKDTLILTAVEEPDLGDRFEYRWKFNGEVYRLLANSGVKYLALRIGDDMAVFPTEGFTGGAKYTELKMQGVSTKKFDYTVSMAFNLDPERIPMLSQTDFSAGCDLAILAEVDGEKYVLTTEEKGEMYYYNVYLGPAEMMDVPYGEYGLTDHDLRTEENR